MADPINNNRPPFRKLRGYAFDPVTSLDNNAAGINEITYKVPWEDDLGPGPDGEYLRVVDRDPASDAVYAPVDLNRPEILASDGLAPSETNPQFHQQMVYAVAMTTIKNFERALGRKVMWSPVEMIDANGRHSFENVRQLLVYPHALRDQNAYYSPDRKALLFGYFNASPADSALYLPGGIVFSCLSHDIIAHETTHALLDGMYSRFLEPTHPDTAGFHEGFSDIVALLQHFTHPEIVRNQVKLVRGALDAENLLAKLAVEFGQSTGEYRSLRDAIGRTVNGQWQRQEPAFSDYETQLECHDRGALLVSAVFEAFLTIYKNRTADLLRIATGGTGILPNGDIHPDLVGRLADEASKTASQVLNMCIRALDYCPPVDLNYGDYLRALITADKELVANDDKHYRVAFINAFRKRGIIPAGVPNLSADTLCYSVSESEQYKKGFARDVSQFLRGFKEKLAYKTNREDIFNETRDFIRGNRALGIKGLHGYLFDEQGVAVDPVTFENITGLVFSEQYKEFGIRTSGSAKKGPSVEIHSLRLHNRIGPDGNVLNQIIMTLSQRCKVAVDLKGGEPKFRKFRYGSKTDEAGQSMTFRGGCTLIFDLDNLTLRHAIRKPLFDTDRLTNRADRKLKYNEGRLKMQWRCMLGDLVEDIGFAHDKPEPLAFIHQAKTPIL